MNRKILFTVIALMLMQYTINAYAIDYSSAGDGNWNNPSTWTPNGVPGAGDNATIQAAHIITITQTEQVNTLICNGTLQLGNNITHNFTVNTGVLCSGDGVFIGNSNSRLAIGGTNHFNTLKFFTGSENLYSLAIGITTGGSVTLNSDLNIHNQLQMIDGKINMGTHTLTLGTSSSSAGTLSHTVTPSCFITGKFKRYIFTPGNIVFPVGHGTKYRPAEINATSITGDVDVTVQAYNTDPGNFNTANLNDAGYVIDRFSTEAHWVFSTNGSASGIALSLGAYGISGVQNYQSLRILRRNDNASEWYLAGTHQAGTGSNTEPVVHRTGLNGLLEFGIGGNSADNTLNDVPLPVSLSSFIQSVTGRNVKLNWVTEKELNNKGFEIERGNSVEGTGNSWKKIGYVDGSGTKNTQTSYMYEDKNLNTGKYKYRLKQIDNNGNYEYHELSGNIEIGIPKKYEIGQNYPNPFNPVTKINFDLPENGLVNIRLYDMLGREVAVLVNEVRNAGYHTVQFDASKLSSGIYFYKMDAGSFSGIKKMSVIK